VYRSIQEVPPALRRQLQQAINAPDAETVVIADERGREEIFHIINGLQPNAQKKVLAALKLSESSGSHFPIWRIWLLACSFLALALLLFWVWR